MILYKLKSNIDPNNKKFYEYALITSTNRFFSDDIQTLFGVSSIRISVVFRASDYELVIELKSTTVEEAYIEFLELYPEEFI